MTPGRGSVGSVASSSRAQPAGFGSSRRKRRTIRKLRTARSVQKKEGSSVRSVHVHGSDGAAALILDKELDTGECADFEDGFRSSPPIFHRFSSVRLSTRRTHQRNRLGSPVPEVLFCVNHRCSEPEEPLEKEETSEPAVAMPSPCNTESSSDKLSGETLSEDEHLGDLKEKPECSELERSIDSLDRTMCLLENSLSSLETTLESVGIVSPSLTTDVLASLETTHLGEKPERSELQRSIESLDRTVCSLERSLSLLETTLESVRFVSPSSTTDSLATLETTLESVGTPQSHTPSSKPVTSWADCSSDDEYPFSSGGSNGEDTIGPRPAVYRLGSTDSLASTSSYQRPSSMYAAPITVNLRQRRPSSVARRKSLCSRPKSMRQLDAMRRCQSSEALSSFGSASTVDRRPSLVQRPSSALAMRRTSIESSCRHRSAPAYHSTSLERRPFIALAPEPRRRRKRAMRVRPRLRPRKIVVVGDMYSGKSGLISAYCRDRFSKSYVPTVLRTCASNARVFGETVELIVVEVAGRDDYQKTRSCAYHKMDVVILCYSADNIESLQRIKDTWLPELKRHAPKVPYILVGTKKDVREDYAYQLEVLKQNSINGDTAPCEDLLQTVVPTHKGSEVAKDIGAAGFVECSAMYRDGTRKVFETAAKIALKTRRRKKMKRDGCSVM